MQSEIQQIAARVREIREIMEISEEEMAEKIGVGLKEYKGYESASSDIPIGKIYQIAHICGVDPTAILMGSDPKMSDCTVVRGGDGMEIERFKGYSFVSLAYNFIDREMKPMIVSLQPHTAHPDLVTHGGQEFNYVLEGVVAVTIRDRDYILNAGDSIYFNPALPHGQAAVGDKPAKFLTVINE
ncbi:MAG: cupin domain-containing protein [Ruminococcaceae bacterium]|nr:cupin domain-containing protein [Oscillospiraceae bacterium]